MNRQNEIADAKMIQELKEAALAATPGQWSKDDLGNIFRKPQAPQEEYIPVVLLTRDSGEYVPSDANARFIAAANPAAILALIAKNERLEKEADVLAGEIREWEGTQWVSTIRDIQEIRQDARDIIAEREAQEASGQNPGAPGK